MHEQSGLDEGKDFGDAKVVSGMGAAHGKRGGQKAGAQNGGIWLRWKPKVQRRCEISVIRQAAAPGAHSSGTTAGRWISGAHRTQACEANCGMPLIANMPITEILHQLGILAKLNIRQPFMKTPLFGLQGLVREQEKRRSLPTAFREVVELASLRGLHPQRNAQSGAR